MADVHLVRMKNRIPWWPAELLEAAEYVHSWTRKRTSQKTLNSTGTANCLHRETATARSLSSSIT